MRLTRSPLPLLLAVALFTAPGGEDGWWRLADRHQPWTPLRLADPLGPLTRIKLARLQADAPACLAALQDAGWVLRPLPDRQAGPGCGLTDAVQISRTALRPSAPFALSCRAALSLALWERHVLQPAALAWLGQPVDGLQHVGSYACRNVYGRVEGRRSRHATADALDVTGFTLADGRRISVLRDWGSAAAAASAVPAMVRRGGPAPQGVRAGDLAGDMASHPAAGPQGTGPAGSATTKRQPDDAAARAAFLRQVQQGACRVFDGALGPNYNAAHADHLHLEHGGYRVCR
jgi:hypothetical protein